MICFSCRRSLRLLHSGGVKHGNVVLRAGRNAPKWMTPASNILRKYSTNREGDVSAHRKSPGATVANISRNGEEEKIKEPRKKEDQNDIDAETPKWTDYNLNPIILSSIKDVFNYRRVSKVQKAIFDKIPIQQDMLIRSKTGTGKTLAFLVPALERALQHWRDKSLQGSVLKDYANRNATTLIIAPTRELAQQIATEARRLVTVKGNNMKALCAVGGESKRDMLKLMYRERNDFIVGTPGRLMDLIQNEKDFSDRLGNIQTVILDEADTLLELGFKQELDDILYALPKSDDRKTFMFSATVSPDIQRIARRYMSKDYLYLNTVPKGEQDSHQLIKQECIVRPANEHMRVVLSLIISEQLKNPTAKIIVFFGTTKLTQLYASAFKTLRRLYPVVSFQQFDIHAQRAQESRSKVSEAFRRAGAGSVLFSTDVSARGVDYPDVTMVIQVGAARSRDLYVHKIGRTGRAGKNGQAILLLAPFERGILKDLQRDFPIVEREFPDSEIELGRTQQRVFDLMYHSQRSLVSEAIKATEGYLMGMSEVLRLNKRNIPALAQSYFTDFPERAKDFEPTYAERHKYGRSSERSFNSEPSRGRTSRPASSRPSGTVGYNMPVSVVDEWRPTRPSEITFDHKKRKNFRPDAEDRSSRRPR